jgi:hypothetical protein
MTALFALVWILPSPSRPPPPITHVTPSLSFLSVLVPVMWIRKYFLRICDPELRIRIRIRKANLLRIRIRICVWILPGHFVAI